MNRFLCTSVICMFLLTGGGCNQQIVDLTYSYNYAYIEGIGEVKVKTWREYDSSDSIQIVTEDGVTYYTDLKNVILINR